MSAKLYVGNLSYSTTDEMLGQAFGAHGELVGATVVLDRMTGKSRGFGFVEYSSVGDAQRAAETMNGSMLDGRALVVNAAREGGDRRPPRGGGGDRPFGGGGGGGDRGGFGGGGGRGGGGGDRGRRGGGGGGRGGGGGGRGGGGGW